MIAMPARLAGGRIRVPMATHRQASTDGAGEVVLFPRRFKGHGPGDDDYWGRMRVYALVLAMTACFVAGGVWLVTAITSIPAHVDCNFSKHRPCHNYPGPAEPVRVAAPR